MCKARAGNKGEQDPPCPLTVTLHSLSAPGASPRNLRFTSELVIFTQHPQIFDTCLARAGKAQAALLGIVSAPGQNQDVLGSESHPKTSKMWLSTCS